MGDKRGFNTGLLHDTAGRYANGQILPPISQVTAFEYESMEELEKVFAHKSMGFAYTRIGNPTLAAFEQKINRLEGGIGSISCSSGMSAISSTILGICEEGDEIIAGRGLYGGTIDLLHDLEKLGIHTVYADELDGDTVRKLVTEKTKAVFGEAISNPSLTVLDIEDVAAAAHEKGIPLVVDSTTATPYIISPIRHGADIVIHSTSKYINGGGNAIGGVITDAGRFVWKAEKHGALADFVRYGKMAFLLRLRTDLWENLGGCMAPVNAYLSYIGADTLGLRMERICSNADALARALDREESISVSYLTLPTHPYHEHSKRLLKGLGGGILTIRAGSKDRAFRIINALKYAKIASNIGDMRTLVIHPASTLYIHTGKDEAEAAGVYEDTIRVSVGIEDKEDLIEDFTNAVRSTI
ncbi:MAG: aminotransferase class V-fold PLP-dependent enzyme [Lachnospiraceae bacterium]|nr:aminotransferase class V-fold PLP-dependent enzyme [Lachnospiraceae bacterium]